METTIEILQREYCPPLDPALVSAIASDYDPLDEAALEQLRESLSSIRGATKEEELSEDKASEAGGFRPSEELLRELGPVCSDGMLPTLEHSSSGTESNSRSISSFGLDANSSSGTEADDHANDEYALVLEKLDLDSKTQLLKEMFPKLKEFTIAHRLKKCDQNFSKTVEELLNQTFFEEEGNETNLGTLKGIDGFAEDISASSSNRKARARKKRRQLDIRDERRCNSLPATPSEKTDVVGNSKWDTMRQDVELITSRTGLPMQTVSSMYHKNGADLSSTIIAILESEHQRAPDSDEVDPVIQAYAIELMEEFPSVQAQHLNTLVRLTQPSSTAAHELAKALIPKARSTVPGRIEIITRLPPIDLNTSDNVPHTQPMAHTRISKSEATALSAEYGLARQVAFSQASTAYRKSKSDNLMAAAAGYYSSIGREYDAKAKGYSAAAADALVDAQSSSKEVDLHGVSVKDGVRIARERVTTWWVSLGDTRVGGRAGAGRAYRIVTGVGRHSEGGKGRIGPAVARMLMREGWKVEVGEGVVTVTGIAKHR